MCFFEFRERISSFFIFVEGVDFSSEKLNEPKRNKKGKKKAVQVHASSLASLVSRFFTIFCFNKGK